ncbi:MAG: preprotein translocase, SecY subunit, preprotein translocase subunit SecY [Candidatus Moranbacteria bacterium GW2011_GWC1_45_18]|nr:MAG: Protein translocase subunit SecY [Candidatus Moranbacteria bacterium GW2011_GWC2_40_12]KKT33885.1 MAG: Protein translocase subunit SecY [Candidatus Moranbacteria bacterium GW2011_GWF2_44_10]KKT99785.1 MAG: preprotein translocase, SecY subunit, preprotein translocase subunit SecY [Candidatus Moranbacteria bacterium GW2011_GWC1_45_18]OGI34967.1 MAG: preprotein translocase subunit SecY [Candidatus Moranbacteria bacterium RIFOXYC1_FULL_44_8]OGI39527.1 MAG: preprotein translocase subunit Sec
MLQKITQIFKVKELRDKILFILGILVVFRLAANIPVPGVNVEQLRQFFENNQFFGLLNMFSGGGLRNISIVMLGVGPYITASIIMQLLTMIVPRLEQIYKEEGEAGRQKFNMWTRWITVPLAALQTFGMISLFRSQGIFGSLTSLELGTIILTATAGTVFLMWLGELITEKNIGNGVSIIIFAGIVASLPTAISQTLVVWDPAKVFTYLGYAVFAVLVIAAVVFITEGQRNIPVSYAKRVRGNRVYGGTSTHLPLRVNQAGVIPIIFAMSIMLFPGMIANFFVQASNPTVANVANSINNIFKNQWFYGLAYFILVVLFTYFYTAVTFDPKNISENLQKQGGYVPGIRPGPATAEYLHKVLNRITLTGSLFLGSIAVLPFVVQGLTNIQTLSIGGTGLLIVVSVVIEIMKQIESQMIMRDYEGF